MVAGKQIIIQCQNDTAHFIRFSDFRSEDCITDFPVLILDDHEIFLQKSVVDLGLSFSSNLAWSKHISDRLKACYIRIISLRRCLPPHLHSQIKIKLYKTYILPKLLYGSQVWSPNRKDLSKLEQFQKNVSKWICKGAIYKTRLISSGLLPRNLLKINDLLFLNRILNGLYDFDFHNFLSIIYPCDSFYYNTRSTLQPVLKVKSTRTKQADNHFFQRIVPLSNWLMKEHNVDSFVEPNIFTPRVKQLFNCLCASDEYVL